MPDTSTSPSLLPEQMSLILSRERDWERIVVSLRQPSAMFATEEVLERILTRGEYGGSLNSSGRPVILLDECNFVDPEVSAEKSTSPPDSQAEAAVTQEFKPEDEETDPLHLKYRIPLEVRINAPPLPSFHISAAASRSQSNASGTQTQSRPFPRVAFTQSSLRLTVALLPYICRRYLQCPSAFGTVESTVYTIEGGYAAVFRSISRTPDRYVAPKGFMPRLFQGISILASRFKSSREAGRAHTFTVNSSGLEATFVHSDKSVLVQRLTLRFETWTPPAGMRADRFCQRLSREAWALQAADYNRAQEAATRVSALKRRREEDEDYGSSKRSAPTAAVSGSLLSAGQSAAS